MPKNKEKKQKYYAVKNGHLPGIYYNWPDAQAQVKGFKRAKFKSFTQLLEAEQWLQHIEPLLGDQNTHVDSGPFERDVQAIVRPTSLKDIVANAIQEPISNEERKIQRDILAEEKALRRPTLKRPNEEIHNEQPEFPFPAGPSKEIETALPWNVYIGCAMDAATTSAWVTLQWELEELCISIPYTAAPPLTSERILLFALRTVAKQALNNPNLSSTGFCVHLGANAYTTYMIATRWMWSWADKQWDIKFPHLDLVIPLHRLMCQFKDSTQIVYKHHTTEPIPTAFISAQQSAANALRGERWVKAEYIS